MHYIISYRVFLYIDLNYRRNSPDVIEILISYDKIKEKNQEKNSEGRNLLS